MNLPTVIPDNVQIGRIAAEHFIDSGLRHFAFCAVTGEVFARKRHEGFARRWPNQVLLVTHSWRVFEKRIEPELDWTDNRRRMREWLKSLPAPVGILCVYDMRGAEVTRACNVLGLRVPDAVAIVSVGNEVRICQCVPHPCPAWTPIRKR